VIDRRSQYEQDRSAAVLARAQREGKASRAAEEDRLCRLAAAELERCVAANLDWRRIRPRLAALLGPGRAA